MPRYQPKGLPSILSEVREKRARRAERAQPFLVLKLTVGICSAIIAYACYVYIGRLCVPMLIQSKGAMGGRGMGVAFLVVFILLATMMIWSYIIVVFTPPGFARDHAAPTDPPPPSLPGPAPPSFSALAAPPSSTNFYSTSHPDNFLVHPDAGADAAGHYVDPNVQEETIGIPYERMRGGGTLDEESGDRGSVQGRDKLENMFSPMSGNGNENGYGPHSSSASASPLSTPPQVDWEDYGDADEDEFDTQPQRPAPAVVRTLPPPLPSSDSTPSRQRNPSGHRNGVANRDSARGKSRGAQDALPVIDDGLFQPTNRGLSSTSSQEVSSNSQRPTSDHERDRRRRRRDERVQRDDRSRRDGGRWAGSEKYLEKGWRKEDLTRKPSNFAILLPEYRYCRRCRIVKPPRAHHCRACGTCILKYDHHCPWIGQCVGARNHRFFLQFCIWAMLFCFWTLSTLIALNVIAGNSGNSETSVDPQEIVVIGLAGLFSFFAFTMGVTHLSLIVTNRTTVEHMSMQNMKEKETEVLSRLWGCWQVAAKRRTKKAWDQEWGRMETEGNLWWAGSFRRNWEQAMGTVWWKWFLPIGPTPSGLDFPKNPRFDEYGRWRPRREWPDELR